MGPSIHHLSYPLAGWRVVRDDCAVSLIDPSGVVCRHEVCASENAARKKLWEIREQAYQSEESA